MKSIKAIIIEDEALTAEKLQLLLTRIDSSIQVEAILESVAASVDWLGQHKADLIFMDIHLSDGKAFEIFEQLNITTPIIFVTAYDQYAIEAFKEYGIDYILKPINRKDLERAITKFDKLRNQGGQTALEIEKLKGHLEEKKQNRFLVNVGKSIKAINTETIAYFYAENKLTFLVDDQDQRYVMDETLEKLDQLTPSYFFRTNRKTLVNIKKIKTIQNHTYSRLLIQMEPATDFELIVPLERVGDFKNRLMND